MHSDDNEIKKEAGYSEYGYKNENGAKSPKPKRKRGAVGFVAALCAASVIGGALFTGFVVMPLVSNVSQLAQKLPAQDPSKVTAVSGGVADQSAQLGGAPPVIMDKNNPVPEIAAKVSSSVVGVGTYDKRFAPGQQANTQDVAYGTGFVISSDGLILTNSHVIEQGQYITVKLNDGKTYDATIKGQDYDSDIAVLKIGASGLTPVAIGNSDKLQVGQQVIAIGNPLGEELSNTVTVGYLGSLDRKIQSGGRTYHVLQTDAAINPGNSGGVLLDTKGQAIGMTTLKSMFAGRDEYGNEITTEGIGFALPINYVMDIAKQLIADGSVQKPGIGISFYMMTEEDAKNWSVPQGALVESVNVGGPAKKAGIKTNDIITAIDNVSIAQISDIQGTIKSKGLNATVTFTIWRNGQTTDIKVVTEDINKPGNNAKNNTSSDSGNGNKGNQNPFRNSPFNQ